MRASVERPERHEDAPQAVPDRRDRRQELGEEHERLTQTAGDSSETKIAIRSAIGVAMTKAIADE